MVCLGAYFLTGSFWQSPMLHILGLLAFCGCHVTTGTSFSRKVPELLQRPRRPDKVQKVQREWQVKPNRPCPRDPLQEL